MPTMKADKMHRALSMATEVAKGADQTTPVLRCIQVRSTTEGVTFTATDRYALLRARAEHHDARDAVMSPLLLGADDARSLLAEVKREKRNPVELWNEDGVVKVRYVDGRTAAYMGQDHSFPDLDKLLTRPEGGVATDAPLGINPALLALLGKLKTHDKHATVWLSAPEENKPVRFGFSDWAVGMMMPVRAVNGAEKLYEATAWADAGEATSVAEVSEAAA